MNGVVRNDYQISQHSQEISSPFKACSYEWNLKFHLQLFGKLIFWLIWWGTARVNYDNCEYTVWEHKKYCNSVILFWYKFRLKFSSQAIKNHFIYTENYFFSHKRQSAQWNLHYPLYLFHLWLFKQPNLLWLSQLFMKPTLPLL